MNMFIQYLQTDPYFYFTTILIVTFSICVHECAHAWTALKQGDDTSMWLGHISLNPRIQMGWQSIIVMLLFGIAWGAVPYNPRNLRNQWSGALVAFAGPLANLLLAFIFALLAALAFRFMPMAGDQNMVYRFFAHAGMLNVVLFVFNMMPLPILDGWKVLSLFIPQMTRLPPQHVGMISWIGIIILWTRGSGLLWGTGHTVFSGFFRFWHMLF